MTWNIFIECSLSVRICASRLELYDSEHRRCTLILVELPGYHVQSPVRQLRRPLLGRMMAIQWLNSMEPMPERKHAVQKNWGHILICLIQAGMTGGSSELGVVQKGLRRGSNFVGHSSRQALRKHLKRKPLRRDLWRDVSRSLGRTQLWSWVYLPAQWAVLGWNSRVMAGAGLRRKDGESPKLGVRNSPPSWMGGVELGAYNRKSMVWT